MADDFGNALDSADKLRGTTFADAKVGQSITYVVTGTPKKVQSMDYDTGKPAFWKNEDGSQGNPKMAFVFPVRVIECDDWTQNAKEGKMGPAHQVGEEYSSWYAVGLQRGAALVKFNGEVKAKCGSSLDKGDVVKETFSSEERPKSGKGYNKKVFTLKHLRRETVAEADAFEE